MDPDSRYAPQQDEATAYSPNTWDEIIGRLRKGANNLNPNWFTTNERRRELQEPAKSVIPEQAKPANDELIKEQMMGGFAPGHVGVGGIMIGTEGKLVTPMKEILRLGRNKALTGHPEEDVWNLTQTHNSPEKGNPQLFEINDANAKHTGKWDRNRWGLDAIKNYNGPIERFYDHPEFYGHVPKALGTEVSVKMGKDVKPSGSFYPDTGRIEAHGENMKDILDILTHESQHIADKVAGRDFGGNPDVIRSALIKTLRQGLKDESEPSKAQRLFAQTNALKLYNKMGSEVKSRMGEEWRTVTPEARLMTSPAERMRQMGYPLEDQLWYGEVPGYPVGGR